MNWKERYSKAHEAHQLKEYPNAVEVGGLVKTTFPKVDTANGLTAAIVNYINWTGGRATRINVQGRLVEGQEKASFGQTISKKKWIKSSTRKGTADISSTISGKSVMWEIKIGNDRPSEAQLKEQQRERKAGGEYFFIKTIEQFFDEYDRIVNYNLFR